MKLVSDSLKNYVPEHSRGMKILVIDDDVESLFHLRNMLQEYSYNVTPTTSTAYASYVLHEAKSPFQLVMASYNVLDMNTLAFLNTMHEKDIPVIFIFSESNDEGVIVKVLAEGAHSFLKKPISPVHLKYVWQPASIKMLERQKKSNVEKTSMVVTTEDGRKRSNSAKRHKIEERRVDEISSCSLPPVKISANTGSRPQPGMEMHQIHVQSGRAFGAHVSEAKQNTIPMAPGGQVTTSDEPNQANLNQQQAGALDQLSRVLLDQDPEELSSNMDPRLVDLYSKYFKS